MVMQAPPRSEHIKDQRKAIFLLSRRIDFTEHIIQADKIKLYVLRRWNSCIYFSLQRN